MITEKRVSDKPEPDEATQLELMVLERAVIEAAVLRRQIEIEGRGHTTSDNLHSGLGLRFYDATKAERDAVDALLRVRDK